MNVRRIRRLRIEGFGHFREQEWEIHPRLQLFTGRNEAGKSTLLAFVRGVLFGFEPRTSAQRYEPLSGGPFGGAVWMEDDAGQFVHIRRSGHDRVAGRLSVALPDGRTAGEDWLHQWLISCATPFVPLPCSSCAPGLLLPSPHARTKRSSARPA